MNHLKEFIREVPDYPKPGILFYDLTTLLQNAGAFHSLVDELCDHYAGKKVDAVVGIEARGFILAPALAYRLEAGFVPVRKPKKLPSKAVSVTYQLEYGTDTLEIHEDAIKPGQSVLLISDDLLATPGGTAAATVELVRKLGGKVVGASLCRGTYVPEWPGEAAGDRRLHDDPVRQVRKPLEPQMNTDKH